MRPRDTVTSLTGLPGKGAATVLKATEQTKRIYHFIILEAEIKLNWN